MHQADLNTRKSLYYQYQVYPFVAPPDVKQVTHHQVVIVGGGPVGLVTALNLARAGIRCVVITADQQVSEGSRALAFTRRSMEILQQVGASEQIEKEGLRWRYGNSIYRGQRVFRLDVPHDEDDRFYPLINLQQQIVEGQLVEMIEQEPLIDLRWGTRFVAMQQTADKATLTLDTPVGEYRMDADWVIATDGAKSAVRQSMKLRMEGDSYEGRFVIADIRVDLDLPTERLAFFDPAWNPGNTILLHREPYGIWRFDYHLPAGESPEEALAPERIATRVNEQLALMGYENMKWEMDWASIYSARAMTLPDYRHGRVLFAGDAAHMLPIFGVRGLNTGWQDAQNIAWKLALVIQGKAGMALLDSYSDERVGAAREIIDEASKSTRFMTPPTAGFRLLRDATLSLALTHEFVRPLLNWRTSRPHEYTDSILNAASDDSALFSAGPAKGATARNIRLGENDYLFDHLDLSFHLFYFCESGGLPQNLADEIDAVAASGIAVGVVVFSRTPESFPSDSRAILIDDSSGHIHRKYGVEHGTGVYLLRPDQHVCARWIAPDAGQLRQAFQQVLQVKGN